MLWARPTLSRLNSRTSGYSVTANSIKEEDEEDEYQNKNKDESDDENEPKLDDDIFDKPVSFLKKEQEHINYCVLLISILKKGIPVWRPFDSLMMRNAKPVPYQRLFTCRTSRAVPYVCPE